MKCGESAMLTPRNSIMIWSAIFQDVVEPESEAANAHLCAIGADLCTCPRRCPPANYLREMYLHSNSVTYDHASASYLETTFNSYLTCNSVGNLVHCWPSTDHV